MSRRWPVPVVLAIAVIAVRVVLVAAYASPVPYWDQWDAEGAYLLAPWIEGTHAASGWFAAHNEHRILWTRVLTLGLFEANGGQWDNLVSALANTLWPGLLAGGLYAGLQDGLRSRAARGALAALLFVCAVVPFGWKNLVVGFQSQFFLMSLLSAAAIAAAARLPAGRGAPGVLAGLALAAVFTMATGLLAAVVAGGVLVLRGWLRQWPWRWTASVTGVLALVAIAALAAVPQIAGHQPLKAQDAGEWFAAAGQTFGWPFGGWGGAIVLWLPTGWAVARLLRKREADPATLFALGLAAWTLLQAAAMAYSRGHDMAAPASRYTDVLAVGLVANAWFALRAIDAWARARDTAHAAAAGLVAMVLALPPLVAVNVLMRHARGDLHTLAAEFPLAQEQTGRLRAYLEHGDARVLQAPPQHVPYPDATRLRTLLDRPSLRAALPWTLRAAGDDGAAAAPLSAAAAALQRAVRARLGGDAIGLPAGERAAWVATADGPVSPQWLGDGGRVLGVFRMPQAGTLQRVGVPLGTGGETLDGTLRLRVCAVARGGACAVGTAPLAAARDNQDLPVALDRPLRLGAGARVRFRIDIAAESHPLALWLHPAVAGTPPLRIREGDGEGERRVRAKAPRLTLGLRR